MAFPDGVSELSSTTVHTEGVDPYASTMAHLSMAPATTTTVVTTTTTTTTKFPPLVFKPPRNLGDRDPKEYPLANAQSPAFIRRFVFEAGGAQAYFEEAEDQIDTIVEVCYIHPGLMVSSLSSSPRAC
jgi:F-box and WD-40 domain protein CDC4